MLIVYIYIYIYILYIYHIVGPRIVNQPTDSYAAAPFSGIFTCSAQGYGPLTISWRKYIGPFYIVSPPDKCNVSTTNSSEVTVSTLEIPNPSDKDAGEYFCVVNASYGDQNVIASKRASLHISGNYFDCVFCI